MLKSDKKLYEEMSNDARALLEDLSASEGSLWIERSVYPAEAFAEVVSVGFCVIGEETDDELLISIRPEVIARWNTEVGASTDGHQCFREFTDAERASYPDFGATDVIACHPSLDVTFFCDAAGKLDVKVGGRWMCLPGVGRPGATVIMRMLCERDAIQFGELQALGFVAY